MRFLKKPFVMTLIGLTAFAGVLLMLINDNFTEASPLSKEEMHSQLVDIYQSDVEDLTLQGNTYEAKLFKDGAEYTVQANAENGKVLSLERTKEAPQKQSSEISFKEPKEETEPPVRNQETEDKENTEEVTDEEQAEPEPEIDTEEEADKEVEEDKPPKEEPIKEPKEKEAKKTEETEEPTKKEPTTLISEEEAGKIALAALPKELTGEVDEIEFNESTDGGFYLVEVDIVEDIEDGADEVVYQIHAISGEVLTATWDD